jgi:hypothetical protein
MKQEDLRKANDIASKMRQLEWDIKGLDEMLADNYETISVTFSAHKKEGVFRRTGMSRSVGVTCGRGV